MNVAIVWIRIFIWKLLEKLMYVMILKINLTGSALRVPFPFIPIDISNKCSYNIPKR